MNTRTIARNAFDSRHPLRQLGGFLLFAGAIYLLISLITYHPADPSLNRASQTIVSNAGGYAGAVLSDLALQVLGLASALGVLVPLSWSWKFMIGRKVDYFWLRFSLLLLSMVLTASLLAALEPMRSWSFSSGYGGAVGAVVHQSLRGLFHNALFVAFVIGAAVFTGGIAFGMNAQEWAGLGLFFKRMVEMVYDHCMRLIHRGQEEMYESDEFADAWYRRVRHGLKERLFFWRRMPDTAFIPQAEDEDAEEAPAPRARRRASPKLSSGQASLALPKGDYVLPNTNSLTAAPRAKKSGMNEAALQQNMRLLENVLKDFGVSGQITTARPGPVVTLYELEPAAGTKSSRVVGLSDDVARSMSAVSARVAVIPGRNAIGIELPNAQRETVFLREMFESVDYEHAESRLPLALGKDIGGAPIIVDLARMPHLLVAGTTGSGKSVAINTMILSLLYKLTPDECKFIMIDPKMLELSVYDGIPHLLCPVVTEPGKAVVALKWTVREMESRYRLMANLGVRNIEGYNKQIREARSRGKQLSRRVQTGFDPDTGQPIIEEAPLDMNELPFIVVIVDEMADLMITSGKDVESSIQRLAQMARAAGIHIIMATQRPSVDVITGVIKANFPTRISFQVTSRIDSRTILGEQGAEQLLGQGDMLYMAGGGRITRVHGPFVSDKEVETVVSHLKAQGEPNYIEDITRDDEAEAGEVGEEGGERDELYDQAVSIVTRDRKASTSYVQRCLKIGYNRAATIIERMEREGIVGPANHVGKREVLARESA